MLEKVLAHTNQPKRLPLKETGRTIFLKVEDIDWIQADGKYVQLHIGGKEYLQRESIGHMEEILDRKKFLRIHRSTIVNIDAIQELQPWFHGECVVILRDGTKHIANRQARKRLEEM